MRSGGSRAEVRKLTCTRARGRSRRDRAPSGQRLCSGGLRRCRELPRRRPVTKGRDIAFQGDIVATWCPGGWLCRRGAESCTARLRHGGFVISRRRSRWYRRNIAACASPVARGQQRYRATGWPKAAPWYRTVTHGDIAAISSPAASSVCAGAEAPRPRAGPSRPRPAVSTF